MKLDPRLAPLVRARTGLAIADDMLGRAIRQRLRERQEGDAEGYMARILDDEAEFADLLDLLVIPETWFFRDPQAIAHAARFAQERHARSGVPVRLLSLPCSTGEEPYTLAMALFDTGLPAQAFEVTAVDINEPSLERARRGLYGRNSFRARDLSFRDRYFEPEGDRHRLAERVRNQVRFRQGNILQLGSLRDGTAFDVVLCRNLLIYFDDQTQGRALSHLAALMHDDGLLCVGSSEMVSAMRHGFASLGVAHASALVKRQAVAPEQPRPPTPAAAPRRKVVSRPPAAATLPARLRARSLPAPAPAPATPVSAGLTPLEEAQRLADAGRGAEAEALLRQLLDADRSQAGAHFLLALILPDARAAEAERALRQALYLEPGHYPALCRLALICERAGRLDEAGRLRERAARIQTRAGDEA
ncbi:protein-glutamate O-methyltransferase CheR [Pseudomonas sp. JUb52]|uniref:CheR family methyltransferase n=1 Tax=Pseudomonas sp. JUb52 TaxID=2485127 RepID=UPI00104B6E1D|nr:protein-glutamate O-methyltransferase CheR [Pseudomonas sp. JUb52]TCQ83977.1 chemotaxis protein methyltransferase WspC [Pseudomonas sp. JUb52]